MKTIRTFILLLTICTMPAMAQKQMQMNEPDGYMTGLPIDVTEAYSYTYIPFSAMLQSNDCMTGLLFKGYNPGEELTRHLKVTLDFVSYKRFVVYEGDCTIPHGGTPESSIPLLSLKFNSPVQAFIPHFSLWIECTGDAASEPVYFESYSLGRNSLPVATLAYEPEKVSFEGVVSSQDGEPVGGALLTVSRVSDSSSAQEAESEITTDAIGSYALTVDAPSSSCMLTVTADGYASYVVNNLFEVGDVVLYNRLDFVADQQATLILPEAPDPSWGRYYRLRRMEGNTIVFEPEDEPQANTPYVIFPYKDFSIKLGEYDLGNLPAPGFVPLQGVKDDGRSWGFYGSYQNCDIMPISIGSEIVLDGTPDCSDGKNGTKPRIGAFRAYLQVKWDADFDHSSPQVAYVRETTEISETAFSGRAYKATYDLQGRRLTAAPRKGVYIRDGRKMVVK